jgi:nuclear receptor-binding protein
VSDAFVHEIVPTVVANISETITDEVMQRLFGPDVVVAEIIHPDRQGVQMKMSDVPVAEKLEKFVEDVK